MSFKCHISCKFFIDAVYQIEEVAFYSYFVESWIDVEFCPILFLHVFVTLESYDLLWPVDASHRHLCWAGASVGFATSFLHGCSHGRSSCWDEALDMNVSKTWTFAEISHETGCLFIVHYSLREKVLALRTNSLPSWILHSSAREAEKQIHVIMSGRD